MRNMSCDAQARLDMQSCGFIHGGYTGTGIALSFPTHLNPISCVYESEREKDSGLIRTGTATHKQMFSLSNSNSRIFRYSFLPQQQMFTEQCKRTIALNEFVRAYNLIALFLSRWPLHTVSVRSGNSFVIFIRIHAQLLSLRRFLCFVDDSAATTTAAEGDGSRTNCDDFKNLIKKQFKVN